MLWAVNYNYDISNDNEKYEDTKQENITRENIKLYKIPNIFYLEVSELNESNKNIYDIEMRGDKQNN